MRSLKEAGALPPHFSSARLLMELAFGWAEVWWRKFTQVGDSEVGDYVDFIKAFGAGS